MAKTLKPDWAFNSYYVISIKDKLDNVDDVIFDLSNCEIVDSEALKLIFQLKKEGKKVEVKNPPEIFYKILNILNLKL